MRRMVARILVIEDDRVIADSMAAALTDDGYTTRTAGSVREARHLADEWQPDIALVDFNMPGRDGLDLAAELRKSNPRMPVAVISANRQQEVLDRACAAGASFLAKPLTADALGEFLKTATQALAKAPS